jgi:5-methylcytosine-specific restriction endonuclease McrA
MAYNAEYHRAYRAANPDKFKAYEKAYAVKRSAYFRKYYQLHKSKLIAKAAAWGKANPEKKYGYAKKWVKKNPDKVAAKFKRWMVKNLPACAIKSKRRRELVRNTESTDSISSTVLAQLISSCAKMKCGICGKNMPKSDRTYDHVIPLAKGGTGHIANLQVVHLSCNCSKNCKTPDQLTGQFEMNFAGNRAHLNTAKRGLGVTLNSTV